MTDDQILQSMGLTQPELQDLHDKLNNFVNTLNPAQKAAFLNSMKTPEQGAAELPEDVTPQRLHSFLKTSAPAASVLSFSCLANQGGDSA